MNKMRERTNSEKKDEITDKKEHPRQKKEKIKEREREKES